MNHLPCDALIAHRAPGLLPKAGGALLQLDAEPEQWRAAVEPWLRKHVKYSQQTLGLALSGPETAHERELVEFIYDFYHRCGVQQKTIVTFAAEWGRNFCKTLVRSPRWATSLQEPWRGRAAFIVSAGPSLDRNGQLLAQCQDYGPVIALNSSAAACLDYGVTPDLVMCSEAVDVSSKLAPMRELGVQMALDAVAHEANWNAAPNAWAYSWAEPNLVPYVLQLGALPLNYTGSVACAAASLAILWGADPVVLIGQDCAYTDGKMYASGTPYADIRCELQDGLLVFTGDSKRCDPLLAVERGAWGGQDRVLTSHDLEVFIDWFSIAAQQHRIVNATEGGARIEYTYELPLACVLDDLPKRERIVTPQPELADTAAVREQLREQARLTLAGNDITPSSSFPLLNMWTAGAYFDCATLGPLQKRDRMRERMELGCREILEALG